MCASGAPELPRPHPAVWPSKRRSQDDPQRLSPPACRREQSPTTLHQAGAQTWDAGLHPSRSPTAPRPADSAGTSLVLSGQERRPRLGQTCCPCFRRPSGRLMGRWLSGRHWVSPDLRRRIRPESGTSARVPGTQAEDAVFYEYSSGSGSLICLPSTGRNGSEWIRLKSPCTHHTCVQATSVSHRTFQS